MAPCLHLQGGWIIESWNAIILANAKQQVMDGIRFFQRDSVMPRQLCELYFILDGSLAFGGAIKRRKAADVKERGKFPSTAKSRNFWNPLSWHLCLYWASRKGSARKRGAVPRVSGRYPILAEGLRYQPRYAALRRTFITAFGIRAITRR